MAESVKHQAVWFLSKVKVTPAQTFAKQNSSLTCPNRTFWNCRKQLHVYALELCVTYLAAPSEPWLTRYSAPCQSMETWASLPARGTVGPNAAPRTNPSSYLKKKTTLQQEYARLVNPSEEFKVGGKAPVQFRASGRTFRLYPSLTTSWWPLWVSEDKLLPSCSQLVSWL